MLSPRRCFAINQSRLAGAPLQSTISNEGSEDSVRDTLDHSQEAGPLPAKLPRLQSGKPGSASRFSVRLMFSAPVRGQFRCVAIVGEEVAAHREGAGKLPGYPKSRRPPSLALKSIRSPLGTRRTAW